MIVRVVKMTFKPGEVDRFLELFEGWRQRIIRFPGCLHLELLHDVEDRHVLMTYSEWRGESDLEAYRTSDTFASVWPVVKELFDAPAEAWSMQRLHHMPANT